VKEEEEEECIIPRWCRKSVFVHIDEISTLVVDVVIEGYLPGRGRGKN
jgi:hypothetical protein